MFEVVEQKELKTKEQYRQKKDRFEKNQVEFIGSKNLGIDSKILINRLNGRFDTAEERVNWKIEKKLLRM